MFISVDIESDGPCPGENSMLSIGAVAYDNDGNELEDFEINLYSLSSGIQNRETMEWWNKYPRQYELTQVNMVGPYKAMLSFDNWLKQFDKPLFVAWPVTFDFAFVYYYFHRFINRCPFGYKGFDIYTYACTLLGFTNNDDMEIGLWSKNFPEEWKEGTENPLEHVAINDARSQGRLFFNMRKWEQRMT